MTIDVVVSEGDRELNKLISSVIIKDPKISVVGNALTGLETISYIMRYRPKVLVISATLPDLDLEGVVKRIMRQYPTPLLILYSKENEDEIKPIKEMDIGIIDFLPIYISSSVFSINDVSLTTRIHILSKLNIEKFSLQIKQGISLARKRSEHNDVMSRYTNSRINEIKPVRTKSVSYSGSGRSSKIIIIGSSTGGPRLLSELVPRFPRNLPPVVIVQHMPVGFISAFSKRLNRTSNIRVVEGKSGDSIMPGTVYLAPGGKHLEFSQIAGGIPKILLTDGAPVNFVKPAVDVTLKSAVKIYGSGVISVILTGMGSDGRDGSEIVKSKGGKVLALNEEDADIYGMNRAVIEAGLTDDVLGKKDIVLGIIRAIEGKI